MPEQMREPVATPLRPPPRPPPATTATACHHRCGSCGDRTGRPHARSGARPSPDAAGPSSHRCQAAQEDPGLGHGHPQPPAHLGVHVRPRRDQPPRPSTARWAWARRSTATAPAATAPPAAAASATRSNGGSVLKTFPHIEDQLRYVYYGTEGYNAAGIEIYGNPDREGGPHITGASGVMPQFGTPAHRVRDPRRRLPRAVHARRRRPDERGVGRRVRELVLARKRRSSPPSRPASTTSRRRIPTPAASRSARSGPSPSAGSAG